MEPRISSLVDIDPFDKYSIEFWPTKSLEQLNLPSLQHVHGVLPHKSQNADARSDTLCADAPARYDSSTRWLAASIQEQAARAPITTSHTAEKHTQSGVSKSSVPLAGVLNNAEDYGLPSGSLQHILQESNARKRRRVDTTEHLQLPKPQPLARKTPKRTRIPPLLPGLHEPPPDAGIIPSITIENFSKDVHNSESVSASTQDLVATESAQAAKPGTEQRSIPLEPKEPKQSRRRKKWTDEETEQLLQGVARYGIGSWKRILSHPDYRFNNRTAVDLKDRFRICCPDDYRKRGTLASTQRRSSSAAFERSAFEHTESSEKVEDVSNSRKSKPASATRTTKVRPSRSDRKGPVELARLGILDPFRRNNRRSRREFTAQEDDALLQGFTKHGPSWRSIRLDPDLGLASRTPTDLRGRFRTRYPERYQEAGLKLQEKPSVRFRPLAADARETATDVQSLQSQPSETSTRNTSSATASNPTLSVARSATLANFKLNHPFFADDLLDDLTDFSPDDDADQMTLDRGILDWARTYPQPPASSEPAGLTLSGMDLLRISPLAPLKSSRSAGNQQSMISLPGFDHMMGALSGGTAAGSAARAGLVNLPPPTDLLVGSEIGGRAES